MKAPIEDIVESDLCIACGACVVACQYDNIRRNVSDYRGSVEVQIKNDVVCATECKSRECGQVCPSINAFAGAESTIPEGGDKSDRVGPVLEVLLGYSPTFQQNGSSSSGGVIREVCALYLERGFSVIALGEIDGGDSIEYDAIAYSDPKDLRKMPGSIYHSIGVFNALRVLENQDGPFVIVSIPCHLEGIDNYIRECNPSLADRIHLRVGIICGWMYSHHAISSFTESMGLEGKIRDVRYRGEDKVGKLKIWFDAETPVQFDRRVHKTFTERLVYRSSFSTEMNRMRCRLCQNHTNVSADISVGDAWLARKGQQKLSIVVVRSDLAMTLVDDLRQQSRLILEKGCVEDIVESQSPNLVYGKVAQKLAIYQRNRHRCVPHYPFLENEKLSFVESIGFMRNDWFRHIIRSRRYKLFRFLYLLSRPLLYVSYLKQQFGRK